MYKVLKHCYKMSMVLALVIGVLLIGIASNVHALPMLQLSSETDTINIEDQFTLDENSGQGMVTWTGSVGNFGINITSGITKPAIGSATDPQMEIISFDATYLGSGGGTLNVKFSEIDFTSPATEWRSSIGGTTDGTVSIETFLDNTNTLFAEGTLLASLGPYSAASFSETFDNNLTTSPSSPYSLTTHVTITHAIANETTNFGTKLTTIPDPAAVFLLGSACLIGFSGLQRKFKQ